jgi:uncharacterized protein YjbJ (UPF0337 family)
MVEKKQVKKATKNATAHVKNAAQVAKGSAKVSAGKALGDRKLETRGHLDKATGKVKQAGQRAKETLKK